MDLKTVKTLPVHEAQKARVSRRPCTCKIAGKLIQDKKKNLLILILAAIEKINETNK